MFAVEKQRAAVRGSRAHACRAVACGLLPPCFLPFIHSVNKWALYGNMKVPKLHTEFPVFSYQG
eukprot:366440-Chlamydomonas_euryale.AAC.11